MADPDERGGAVALESPVGVVAVVLLTLALAGAGYWWQAQLGALLGALGGIVLGMGAQAVLRARAMNRELRERAVPSLQALPPEQAMQVLSAMAGKGGDAPIFSSPLLARLDELRRDAEVNLAGSVALAEDLRAKHPRSPAVERLLADLHRRADREREALRAAAAAVTKALDGGMNRVAMAAYLDVPEASRPRLVLATDHRERLAAVLETHGHAPLADEVRRSGTEAAARERDLAIGDADREQVPVVGEGQ